MTDYIKETGRRPVLAVLTSNKEKLVEIRRVCEGLDVIAVDGKGLEPQLDEVAHIAKCCLADAVDRGIPVVDGITAYAVDDSGLYGAVDGLRSAFPGPYAETMVRELGPGKVAAAMNAAGVRRAQFMTAVAVVKAPVGENSFQVFVGETWGAIVPPKGGGWGFDPVFLPEWGGKTLGEMSPEERDKVSPRAKAFRAVERYILGGP